MHKQFHTCYFWNPLPGPISLDTFVLSFIHSFFSVGSLPDELEIWLWQAKMAAKNENMNTGSEPAVKREWM